MAMAFRLRGGGVRRVVDLHVWMRNTDTQGCGTTRKRVEMNTGIWEKDTMKEKMGNIREKWSREGEKRCDEWRSVVGCLEKRKFDGRRKEECVRTWNARMVMQSMQEKYSIPDFVSVVQKTGMKVHVRGMCSSSRSNSTTSSSMGEEAIREMNDELGRVFGETMTDASLTSSSSSSTSSGFGPPHTPLDRRDVQMEWRSRNDSSEDGDAMIQAGTNSPPPSSPSSSSLSSSSSSSSMTLSHVSPHDGSARMVDVSSKSVTHRKARAACEIQISENAVHAIKDNTRSAKGDVLGVARIGGINGAKLTSMMIPLCHPLQLNNVHVNVVLDADSNRVLVESSVSCDAKTGVEMEAMCAAAGAALTVYDMCKAVDKSASIHNLRLLHKSGGRSGDFFASRTNTPLS